MSNFLTVLVLLTCTVVPTSLGWASSLIHPLRVQKFFVDEGAFFSDLYIEYKDGSRGFLETFSYESSLQRVLTEYRADLAFALETGTYLELYRKRRSEHLYLKRSDLLVHSPEGAGNLALRTLKLLNRDSNEGNGQIADSAQKANRSTAVDGSISGAPGAR